MSENTVPSLARARRKVSLLRLLSLRSDQASNEEIDETLRDNTRLAGTNMWVLMFAIVIASVGLNVNSTAVVIGAMLISPLMGPIIGIGYGAAVHDYELIRQSFRNLGIFIGISLLASTTYFWISPLREAHSEILARTAPNIWDVLIAFFGGAAGMIGLTRKEKTTLIPGVAIATALMPPICTAGYGLATGQFRYFFGAFYLFVINAVFIAFATLVIARVLRLPMCAFPDERARLRGRIMITGALVLTLVPSVYLAYQLVNEQIFASKAERFVRLTLAQRDDVTLLSSDINAKEKRIAVTVIGKAEQAAVQAALQTRLQDWGLGGATLKVRHPSDNHMEVTLLKQQLENDWMTRAAVVTDQNTARIVELESHLSKQRQNQDEMRKIEAEIRAQLPRLQDVAVSVLSEAAAAKQPDGVALPMTVLVALGSSKKLPAYETERLERWLKARLPGVAIQLWVGRVVPPAVSEG